MSLAFPPDEDYVVALFRDACRLRGLKRALDYLPPPKRKAYEQALAATTPAWWRSDELWSRWPKLLTHLGLLTDKVVT